MFEQRNKADSLAGLVKAISTLIIVSGIALWVLGYYLERGNNFAWALMGFVGFVIVLLLVLFTFRVIMGAITARDTVMLNENLKENVMMMNQVQKAINAQNQNALLRQAQNPQLPAPGDIIDINSALDIDDGVFSELDQ